MIVESSSGAALGPPIVGPAWLAEHYDAVVVADVRWYLDGRSGYDAYVEQHLPDAVFVDLDRCLSAPPSAEEGRHPLPAPAVFASAMAALGISGTSTVVAYDDDGGRIAARLVWLLRATGHAASLLDGGIDAWPGPFEGPFERARSKVARPRDVPRPVRRPVFGSRHGRRTAWPLRKRSRRRPWCSTLAPPSGTGVTSSRSTPGLVISPEPEMRRRRATWTKTGGSNHGRRCGRRTRP